MSPFPDHDRGVAVPAAMDPCGPDLEYDADFLALEAALRGQSAQEFRDQQGATILIAGQEINWEQVRVRAEALLGRSTDLRLAVSLTRALLHGEGVGGLVRGLTLIDEWLDRHWDGVHPRLDAEDRSPMMRLNALAALSAPEAVLGDLRASLSSPAGFAHGDKLAGLARQAFERLQSISDSLERRVGLELVPDFSRLRATLQGLAQTAEAAPDAGALSVGEAPAAVGGRATESVPIAGRVASAAFPSIQCRADVVEMLEILCQYLDQFEPGSPVQLLLRRACRMMGMNFLELIQDLAPDGLGQIEMAIGGRPKRE